ncbi:MAG: hypothetical protein GTO02_03510, partial [Candidatus Dadabacteria bacterium]|nr:hypothetical protein [Candidatus Dadabacteria bacterium]
PKAMDQALKMKKLRDTTPEDTKTEQFLNATKDLSPEQYAEYILKLNNAKGMNQVLETIEVLNQNELL